MPKLDWEAFAKLPGDPTRNWELLCRGLIARNYRRCGQLKSVRQQPGVEFHLSVEVACGLGNLGTCWGWQCKWYELPKDKSLGSTRRKKIEDAIRTTEKHLPQVTDWVLWVRELPRKADVDWFNGLNSGMRLLLWDESEVENHLCSEAAVLRSTYFGELILTPDQLLTCHSRAVEPIKKRWDPLVHVEVEAERELRRALAEPGAWKELPELGSRLRQRAADLRQRVHATTGEDERRLAENLGADLGNTAQQLLAVAECCDSGRPDEIVTTCDVMKPRSLPPLELHRLCRDYEGRSEQSERIGDCSNCSLRPL